jgi:ATP-dependent RNA helicase DeaD
MTSEPSAASPATVSFNDLKLPQALLDALRDVGYETPSPIQAATIPPLLEGRDLVGQAQTGTGKTAAFALPVLARVDVSKSHTQALVLAPTRELAIQVAEAFQKYATKMPGFHVLPIYGGQPYGAQLHGLKRGAHVVVGTPGRVIDHLERKTLDLSQLTTLVLDEADEMLRMGFIDDVKTVLEKTPATRQIALFSATMPTVIRKIAQTYLRDPAEVTIAAKTTTAANIRQRYWLVSGHNNKLDALTRILEAEAFDAMIVFTRTKQATEELAEKLEARGFSASAINGDIAQAQRERTVQRLKDGQLDILVATDVAARGLDVERISHVLNFDIPYDTESYVHRIGRTGRAGRNGDAILFVAPRERGMLRAIERATRQTIDQMNLPSVEAVNDRRVAKFMERIDEMLTDGGLEQFEDLIARYESEHEVTALQIAAALAKLVQGKKPLLMPPDPEPRFNQRDDRERDRPRRAHDDPRPQWTPEPKSAPPRSLRGKPEVRDHRPPRPHSHEPMDRQHAPTPFHNPADASAAAPRPPREERTAPPARSHIEEFRSEAPAAAPRERPRRESRERGAPEEGMSTYRVEVGNQHAVKPSNIVGAIANEAGLDSKHIGRIEILDDHTLIDLPAGMPDDVFQHLKKVWVSGQQLRITRDGEPPTPPDPSERKKPFVKREFDKGGDKPFPKRDFKPGGSGYPKRDGAKGGGKSFSKSNADNPVERTFPKRDFDKPAGKPFPKRDFDKPSDRPPSDRAPSKRAFDKPMDRPASKRAFEKPSSKDPGGANARAHAAVGQPREFNDKKGPPRGGSKPPRKPR